MIVNAIYSKASISTTHPYSSSSSLSTSQLERFFMLSRSLSADDHPSFELIRSAPRSLHYYQQTSSSSLSSRRFLHEITSGGGDRFSSGGYFYQDYARPWCFAAERDYCPLVIATMTFIIIITFLLIVYFAIRMGVKCKWLKKFGRLIRRKLGVSRIGDYNSSDSSSDDDYEDWTSSSRRRRTWMRQNLSSSSQQQQNLDQNSHRVSRIPIIRAATDQRYESAVWFTDLDVNLVRATMPQPPPSYESSQNYQLLQQSSRANAIAENNINGLALINIKSYPRTNDAFLMETQPNQTVQQQQPLFPEYRCVTLTTSNKRNLPARSNTLPSNGGGDEVPPAYETVVSNFNDRRQQQQHVTQEETLLFNPLRECYI